MNMEDCTQLNEGLREYTKRMQTPEHLVTTATDRLC